MANRFYDGGVSIGGSSGGGSLKTGGMSFQQQIYAGEVPAYGIGALNIFGQFTDQENIISQVIGLNGNGMDPLRFEKLETFWVITANEIMYKPSLTGQTSKYNYSDIIFSAHQRSPFHRLECVELIKNESGTRWTQDDCLESLPGRGSGGGGSTSGGGGTFPNLNVNAQGKKIAGTVKK